MSSLFYLIVFFCNIFCNIFAYRVFVRSGVVTILAFENEKVDIQYLTDMPMPMTYCGFTHPNGKRFAFSGDGVRNGRCAITIKATVKDSGEWLCHIGKTNIGVESMQKILLRVVDQVAAIRPNITATHGKPITMECVTVNHLTPIRYCRFEPPSGTAFSINSDITENNAILGKYFFPQNRSIDRGDCAVTINNVRYEDVGSWTCSAALDNGQEYSDTITLDVEGMYAMSTASARGVVFGIIGSVVVVVALAVIVWRYRRCLTGQQQEPEVIEIQNLEQAPSSPQGSQRRVPVPIVVVQSPSLQSAASDT
ncbi:hypothetical protein ACJJTC_011147 [Scirpophaga incertulas]